MAPQVTATVVDDDPQSYETKHVHAVYDEIASHFSSTRYKVSSVPLYSLLWCINQYVPAMADNLAIYLVLTHRMGRTRLGDGEWEVSSVTH